MTDRAADVLRVLAVLVVVSWPLPVHADLLGDAEALLSSWRRSGAEARRVATVFLEAGDMRLLVLARPGSRSNARAGCLEVVALAERQVSFTLAAPSGLSFADAEAARQESRAGVARIADCGEGTLASGTVAIQMSSPRGAVEILVVRHRASIAPVERVLRDRALGPAAPESQLGQPLALAPVAERADRAERIARAEGARTVVRVRARAGERGGGTMLVSIAEGCHRMSLLADASHSRDPVDVDAEVRLVEGDILLRRDRSHAPDARLDFCIGESARVEVRFVGAGGPVSLLLLDAYWPIPAGVPSAWGPRARAGLAGALHRRRAPILAAPPLYELTGGAGLTLVPIEVEPGACYVSAFTVHRGQAAAGRLTIVVGGITRYDEGGDEPIGAAVSFCVPEHASVAQMHVELRAASGTWVLATWHVGGPSW